MIGNDWDQKLKLIWESEGFKKFYQLVEDEYKNKELWIKYMLEDIETTNTKKIADLILNEAIDNNFGSKKDDMSIVVCKFKEKS